jgi:hypothetical protein
MALNSRRRREGRGRGRFSAYAIPLAKKCEKSSKDGKRERETDS